MDTIFTTKQQLFYADKARYTKKYESSLPDMLNPTLEDLLALPVKTHSPRWAWVTVDSPEGFGSPHTIKLHFSTIEGLPCEGVCYHTKEDCIKDMISLYMHRVRLKWDDIMEAFNLYRDQATHGVVYRHKDRLELAGPAIKALTDNLQKAMQAMEPLLRQYKEEQDKRKAAWEQEYKEAKKGTPEEVAGDGYIYLPVEYEGGEYGCFRASKRGSGFFYQQLVVHDYVANWYSISVRSADKIKHDPNWCAVMHPTWREAVYQKPEQVF